MALRLVINALERAEKEFPVLAAPDGKVTVDILALRSVIQQMDAMRDIIALAPTAWRARWYGSPPQHGSSIITERGDLIAYFGGNEDTHTAAGIIVSAHNLAMAQAVNK